MDRCPHPPMVVRSFLLLLVLSLGLVGYLLWPFLSILVLSFLLAGLFKPLFTRLAQRMPAIPASLITCLFIIVVVFVPLTLFILTLSQEAFALYQVVRDGHLVDRLREVIGQSAALARFQELLNSYGFSASPEDFLGTLREIATSFGRFLYSQASSWAANVLDFLFSFFMMILTIFFLLIDRDRLDRFLFRLSPLPEAQSQHLMNKFQEIAGAVLIGNGICGLIQGVLGGVALSAAGFSQPLLWGSIMAILAFVPIIGIGLVLVPAALYLYFKGAVGAALGLTIFYGLVTFIVDNLLKPKIVGDRIKMHTLVVFLSIVGGLAAFGMLGIIYGPLIIATFLTLAEMYMTHYDRYLKSWGDESAGEGEPRGE